MVLKTKIIFLGVGASVLYALLAYIPFGFDAHAIPPAGKNIMIYFLLINLGLWSIYLLAFQNIKKQIDSRSLVKLIVLFTVVFSIILILLPSIGSADIFNYIFRARVFTVYGENPYLVATENFSHDLFYHFSPKEWNNLLMQYGPLWTGISIGFSFIAKDSFFWNQFLYKLLAVMVNFGILYFVWCILSLIKPDYRIKGLFLYAWSPLILFEVVNNAHNDMVMIFLVVAAIYFFLRKKYLTSLVLLLLSVLVKYITLFLFPVFLIFLFKEVVGKKERIRLFGKTSIVLLVIIFLSYFPFWEGWQTFQGIFQQSRLISFMNLSLFPSFTFGGTYLLGNFFSWSYDIMMQIVRIFGVLVFLAFYLWQLRLLVKNKNSQDFIYRIFLVLFIYTIYAVFSLQPWYFLWILPLAVLIDKKYFLHFIFFITLIGLFSYTFVVISILFVLIFVLLLFLSFFTKGRYFTSFLGFR